MAFRKTCLFVTLLALLLPAGVRAACPAIEASRDLPNFHCINDSFYRGGQPSLSGIEQLGRLGIKTIIDLRGAGERSHKEEELAAKLGIHYYNIAMSNWKAPSAEQVGQFFELTKDPAKGPFFVHCRRGADRTGLLVALYRLRHDSWSADQAYEEMREMGARRYYFWYKNYLYTYAQQHAKDGEKSGILTSGLKGGGE